MSDRIEVQNRYDSRLSREYDTLVLFDVPTNTVEVCEVPRGMRTMRQHNRIAVTLDRRQGANFANVSDLVALLEGEEAQELLLQVAAGHEVVWDGSNHVGRMDEDACCALERLERLIEPVWDRLPGLWTAGEWFYAGSGPLPVAGETTDEELSEIATAEVERALPEHHLRDDVLQFLTQRRDELALDLAEAGGVQ